MSSILFALKYPTARIIAVEPEPSNFVLLARNTAPYETITPIPAALWLEDGEVTLGESNAHPKGAFQIVEKGRETVRAITMDTLLRENSIDSIDFLKIDIEGAEVEVFESCPWIEKVRVMAIELHDRIRPGCSSTVKAAVSHFQCDQQDEVTFFSKQSAETTRQHLNHPTGGSISALKSPAA